MDDDHAIRDHLYVVSPDGSKQISTPDSIHYIDGFECSGDGSKITMAAASSDTYMIGGWVMDVDGSNLSRIYDGGNCSDPSWSPDDSLIAFHISNKHIVIIDPLNSEYDQINFDSICGNLDWSPVENLIVFWHGSNLCYTGLHLLDLTHGTRNVLIDYGVDDDGDANAWIYYPEWSPDGEQIAFIKAQESNFYLMTINKDGSDVSEIMNLTELWKSGNGIVDLAWSPDGKKFALFGQFEIYIVDMQGAIITRIHTFRYGKDLQWL